MLQKDESRFRTKIKLRIGCPLLDITCKSEPKKQQFIISTFEAHTELILDNTSANICQTVAQYHHVYFCNKRMSYLHTIFSYQMIKEITNPILKQK